MIAYDIAAGMTWDIDCENWEQFPIAQNRRSYRSPALSGK